MNKFMIALVMLGACVCGDNDRKTTGEYAVEMCGPVPPTPGVVVWFPGNGRAVLWQDNYQQIVGAMNKLSDWAFCVQYLR